MYRGSHIAPHERIEAIEFNGRSWSNEQSVTFCGWLGVRILGDFKKNRKVDTKVFRQKCWVGPPTYRVTVRSQKGD